MNRAQRRAAGISNKNERKAADEARRRQMLTTLTLQCAGADAPCQERTAVPFAALRNPVEFNETLENQGWSVGVTAGYEEDIDHLTPLCGACSLKAFSETIPSAEEVFADFPSESASPDMLLHGLLEELSTSLPGRLDRDEPDQANESAPV